MERAAIFTHYGQIIKIPISEETEKRARKLAEQTGINVQDLYRKISGPVFKERRYPTEKDIIKFLDSGSG